MRQFTVALCVLAVFAQSIVARGEVPHSTPDDKLWTWYQDCPARQSLRFDALVDGKRVFTATVPVCMMLRREMRVEPTQRRLAFFFRAPGTVFAEHRPAAGGGKIEANIWQAGSESYAILFGISLVGDNVILMNSIFIADPNTKTEVAFGGGLVLTASCVRVSHGVEEPCARPSNSPLQPSGAPPATSSTK